LLEALKREFWPKEEGKAKTEVEESSEENSEEKAADEEAQPKCDYCGNSINTRAYRMHGKVICSPCLHSRFDDYTSKTFQRITNKSLDEVGKKI